MKNVHYILLATMMLLSSCGEKNFADGILQMQSLIGMIDMEYHRNLNSKIQSYMDTPCDMESGYVLILYHTK